MMRIAVFEDKTKCSAKGPCHGFWVCQQAEIFSHRIDYDGMKIAFIDLLEAMLPSEMIPVFRYCPFCGVNFGVIWDNTPFSRPYDYIIHPVTGEKKVPVC